MMLFSKYLTTFNKECLDTIFVWSSLVYIGTVKSKIQLSNGSYLLELQPTSHTNGALPVPVSRTHSALGDNGDTNAPWTLDTTPLDPCGYTVSLHARSRVILNSRFCKTPVRVVGKIVLESIRLISCKGY